MAALAFDLTTAEHALCTRGLIEPVPAGMSRLERGSRAAWASLLLARLALRKLQAAEARMLLAHLSAFADRAPGPLARRLRRDLRDLAGPLAVAAALSAFLEEHAR